MEKFKKVQKEYGKISVVFISLVLFFSSVLHIYSDVRSHTLAVSFLDVGQGDAILVVTPDKHTMLVDGGATNIVLERLVNQLPFLTNTIDVLVATHPDADHVTGLIPVLEKYSVKNIVMSPAQGSTEVFNDLTKYVDDEHADIHVTYNGDTINFHDGVIAHILYPYQGYVPTHDTNDASVSMVITYGDESFLLTGDLPRTRESYLLQKSILPRHVTAYKAGHHGSKTSNSEQLLSYITPEYAVISAGKNNRYGHPSSETIERLQKYSKEIISTIDRGTISFITDGKSIKVETTK